mmetsp:Transcript_2106/g.4269  ORF Transcript_2106/g.4269 Transcript_2106/m.4269 type:complete len:137 (-) Transcript_2106:162-572(-)
MRTMNTNASPKRIGVFSAASDRSTMLDHHLPFPSTGPTVNPSPPPPSHNLGFSTTDVMQTDKKTRAQPNQNPIANSFAFISFGRSPPILITLPSLSDIVFSQYLMFLLIVVNPLYPTSTNTTPAHHGSTNIANQSK